MTFPDHITADAHDYGPTSAEHARMVLADPGSTGHWNDGGPELMLASTGKRLYDALASLLADYEAQAKRIEALEAERARFQTAARSILSNTKYFSMTGWDKDVLTAVAAEDHNAAMESTDDA